MSFFVPGSLSHLPYLSIKDSTLSLYEKEWSLFLSFCQSNALSALPASSLTVEHFMSHHVKTRAMSTLSHALSAISHYHSRFHFKSPTITCSISRALERDKCSFGKPSVSVKNFTIEHLILLAQLAYAPSCSFVFLRTIWRIFIEFFGILRFNEVANLTFNDIIWTSTGFNIFIKKSKTDQHSKGDYVSIIKNKNAVICPVALTLFYLNRLNIKSGFLLPNLRGKFFVTSAPLLYNTALCDLRKCLSKVGIDPNGIGKHSGRRGGTTAAALAGASIDELMLQGRWKSQNMPRLYSDNAIKLR